MNRLRILGGAVCALLITASATAQPFEQALDNAADELAASMARQGFGADTAVGVARFLGRAGVPCEPLSSLLTGGMRRSLIRHTERMAVDAKVVETMDLGAVRAVVSGSWVRGAEGTARLTVKLGDVTSMEFRDIAVQEVRFDTTSLPPEARRCVLELEPIEREVIADRALIAREAPSSVGKKVARVESGETMWVSARVLSEGAKDWFVVRLADDQNMPVGMRERRAFVFGVTLPDEVLRRFKVSEIDTTMVAEKTAKIRAEPSVRSDQLGLLSPGTVVDATGRVVDRDWYRISWRGEDAYVFASLVAPVDAGEAAAWRKVAEAKDREPLEGFLAKWPKGRLAAMAKARLAKLGPPPLAVEIWTERKSYRAGENVKVFLKGNKDFFANVIYVDAGGNKIQLLPNAYRQSNSFAGGKTYQIPDDTDRFDLTVGEPFGQENIVVFASTAPQAGLRGEDIGAGLSLLSESLSGIRDKTRGVGVTARAKSGVKTEFHESSAGLTTGP